MRDLDTYLTMPQTANSNESDPHATLNRLRQGSTFLNHYLAQLTPAQLEDWQQALVQPFDHARFIVPAGDEAERYLRQLRPQVISHLLWRDLVCECGLEEIVGTMTAFADQAVAQLVALHHAQLATRYGEPVGEESGQAQQLIVMAMGKQGGGELNVSSDIDLILLYPEEGETAKGLSNHEFFVKLGQRLVASLSEVTAEGFVFRVDTALRPNGASGPLACGFGMLQNYFYTQGREWERYAWQKARALTGESTAIVELMKIVRPFVYRRYLDFSVIQHLREMHRQIRAEAQRQAQQNSRYRDSVKIGAGGIRQIEFLTQMPQLLRGGREISLQMRSTRAALTQLGALGLMPDTTVHELLAAYDFLRRVEHAIQFMEDAQNHYLPEEIEAQNKLIALLNYPDYASLLTALEGHRKIVSGHFSALFDEPKSEQASKGESNELDPWESLFAQPKILHSKEETQQKIRSLTQRVSLLITDDPAAALVMERFSQLIIHIAGRGVYLSLLLEYPRVLEKLLHLQKASAWAAHYLTQHPILLDDLIAPSVFDATQFSAHLAEALRAQEGDVEAQMLVLRERHQAQLFALLLQDLSGQLSIEALSDELTLLADVMVQATLALAWRLLPQRHRETPQIAVIAYGKLGSKELSYRSDLDLVFVYDDADESAGFIYSKLVQKFCSLMTTPTTAGILFEVDLALRPNGASGVFASSLAAFSDYQKNSAWLWEHQALTRARCCAGAPVLCQNIAQLRHEVLASPRDPKVVAKELVEMRDKMRAAHPEVEGWFHLKNSAGGMIDLEFIVQFWILARPHLSLLGNSGNIALLHAAATLGYTSAARAEECAAAYRALRYCHHQLALQNDESGKIDIALMPPECLAVMALWQEVFSGLR